MSLAEAEGIHRLLAVALVVGSLVAVWRFDRPNGRWGDRLRERFVMGVPWGTLVSLGVVLAAYLFVQGGYEYWFNPVTVAFSAWSYFYPLGVVTAAFSHSGPGHLVSNLTTAAVVMPLAEYAFGHYPRARGSQSFASPSTNPWVRALVVFPAGVLVIGLATALFSWGPVIGFSGVVFAAVGFALVRYPMAAVVALVARGAAGLTYRALQNPVLEREARARFVTPGWAGIAVQGHALGLFLGAAAGVALLWHLRKRGDVETPSALRVWFGAVLAAMSLSLYALWWIRGGDTYVLYRAVGVAFVAMVALLIVVPVASSNRRLVGRLTRRQAATLLFLVPLLVMSLVAVPLNLNTVDGVDVPEGSETVTAGDYTLYYAEGVPNGMVNVVDVSLFGETTSVRTSGLVVVSERRNVWSREVPPGKLATDGWARVVVGGVGWREAIFAKRQGWSAIGGPTAYHVRIGTDWDDLAVAYESDPATADPVLAGHNASIVPRDGEFFLNLSKNGSLVERVPIPAENETVTAGGIEFERDGRRVVASIDGTEVTVARKERYRE